MHSVLFISLCVIISSVKSAVYLIDHAEIPGHVDECYDEDTKAFYKKGEVIKNEGNECAERRCLGFREEIGKVRMEILTCPAVEAGPGCTVIQDPTKPFPECCPQLVLMPSIDPKSCDAAKGNKKTS